MNTDEMPPELDDEPKVALPDYHEPRYDPYASPRPVDSHGEPASGYRDVEDPYRSLGGLARPDSYGSTLEFDCPTCKAKKGDKCTVWVELLKRTAVRKMPCIARIRLAKERGMV